MIFPSPPLALVRFSLFPLMPPRLLADCGEFGGCLAAYPFVDTLAGLNHVDTFKGILLRNEQNEEFKNAVRAASQLHAVP